MGISLNNCTTSRFFLLLLVLPENFRTFTANKFSFCFQIQTFPKYLAQGVIAGNILDRNILIFPMDHFPLLIWKSGNNLGASSGILSFTLCALKIPGLFQLEIPGAMNVELPGNGWE